MNKYLASNDLFLCFLDFYNILYIQQHLIYVKNSFYIILWQNMSKWHNIQTGRVTDYTFQSVKTQKLSDTTLNVDSFSIMTPVTNVNLKYQKWHNINMSKVDKLHIKV